jgi:hypothetical protein
MFAHLQTVSFEECGKQYIKATKLGWKSAKHAGQWTSTLEKWAYPILEEREASGLSDPVISAK